MQINIRESAIRDLKKIDQQHKERIHNRIKTLKNFPDIANIKKLTDFEPAYRLRCGDYRILFDVKNGIIDIGRILHRKEIY
ncbi:MAG: type II toxin-antitoxin system RelE/ParE family toxin [Desulfamplus sp.]|nr:type II toxin-antitoxin system RelE/ParE family toxin [Desulfamplus sp.]